MPENSLTPAHDVARAAWSSVLRLRARLSSSKAGIVLVYHRVGGAGGDQDFEILPAVSQEEFERQLEHLRRHYRVVSAASILEAVSDRRRGQRFPVAITFDDDLASHARDALPALRREGLHATFFLCGASLDGPYSFWWEDLQRAIDERLLLNGLLHVDDDDLLAAQERRPRVILELAGAIVRLDASSRREVSDALREAVGPPPEDSGLREEEVVQIASAGGAVGFHTRWHHALPGLADDDLEEALRLGRDDLATADAPLELISYPHGKADARVAEASRGAGFTRGFTTARGLVRPETDPFLIPRTVPDLSARALATRLARLFAEKRQPSRRRLFSTR